MIDHSSGIWLAVAFRSPGFLVNGAWLCAARTRRASRVHGGARGAARRLRGLPGRHLLRAPGAPPHQPMVVRLWSWMPVGRLQIDLAFQVDQLSTVMLLVVTGVGSLIHLFSVGYMQEDPGYARYFAYLNLFVVFMLVLVLGSSLPGAVHRLGGRGALLLPADRLLVQRQGQRRRRQEGLHREPDRRLRRAGGDVPALAGRWAPRLRRDRRAGAAELVAAGRWSPRSPCFSSSAAPASRRRSRSTPGCPDAMAGPTPVSALIHAATMVTAGVYLVARTNVLFAMAPVSSAVVAGIGAVTALFAATIGLKQYDIKKVLAYSTVSQLGYMFLGVGSGAYAAGVFHLVTHAFFKALLFLGSGSVIHAMHHAYHATHSHEDAQDMRNMGGLRQYLPWTFWLMTIATWPSPGAAALGLLLQGRDPRLRLRSRGGDAGVLPVLRAGRGGGAPHRVLHGAAHGDDVPGREPHRGRRSAAPARGALDHDGSAGRARRADGGRRRAQPADLRRRSPGWSLAGAGDGGRPAFAKVELPHGSDRAGLLVGAAVLVGVVGLVIGYRPTLARRIPTAHEAPEDRGFARVLNRKYFVDELYDAARGPAPRVALPTVLWKGVDQGVIDGAAVNGSGPALARARLAGEPAPDGAGRACTWCSSSWARCGSCAP